ncbi:hypothetical protein ACIBG8_54330 [Nonomuraea sp. NPDC050556]|uniref:hypothetical protein n=1 Tax=Nonomuraea sp. NPDC050556 TaxID=3364369 RepID=UPI00379CF968
MKRLAVSVPDEIDSELRKRHGDNVSRYVTRAVRAALAREELRRIDAHRTPDHDIEESEYMDYLMKAQDALDEQDNAA